MDGRATGSDGVRVAVNRLILWLALAGMVLALHLWIQKARDFDQGCLGLEKPAVAAAADEGDCRAVNALPASHLFGVSNAAWGYAFYFALALAAFAKILAGPAWGRRLHLAGEVAVAVALLYSARLVYLMAFVAKSYCVLCLVSAGLVATLFALHAVLRWRGGWQPVAESERLREIALAVGGLFAMSGVLVGVLLFVNRLGTRSLDQGETGREFRQLVGRALPMFIDGDKLQEMRACRFEWSAPALDLEKFVGPGTPFVGDPQGVRVVLFVDPNCPHCRAYFPDFMAAVEKLKDRARFTVLPRVLWKESIPQAAALRLAEGSGKYFEVWRAMFAQMPGPHRGLTVAQIEALFREQGLDTADLAKRLEAERPAVEAARAAASAGGINGVPAVYVETRQVWVGNRSPACLDTLLERVRSGAAKVR